MVANFSNKIGRYYRYTHQSRREHSTQRHNRKLVWSATGKIEEMVENKNYQNYNSVRDSEANVKTKLLLENNIV